RARLPENGSVDREGGAHGADPHLVSAGLYGRRPEASMPPVVTASSEAGNVTSTVLDWLVEHDPHPTDSRRGDTTSVLTGWLTWTGTTVAPEPWPEFVPGSWSKNLGASPGVDEA